ncbi:MAG: hypothetical protein LBL83_02920 [Clostridiales bacterium]|jgi:hypothetical protein|nr:hypothetical protein [Clostridiales bacterium]
MLAVIMDCFERAQFSEKRERPFARRARRLLAAALVAVLVAAALGLAGCGGGQGGDGAGKTLGASGIGGAAVATGEFASQMGAAGASAGQAGGAGEAGAAAPGAMRESAAGAAGAALALEAASALEATEAVDAVGAVVAEINGEPVHYGELEMFAAEAAQLADALMLAELERAAAETSALAGRPKAAFAAELAVKALVPYKIAQIELKSRGELEDISFSAFVSEWEAENRRRDESARKGEAVYGPIRYEKRVYYDYLQSERLSRLKELTRAEPDEAGMRRIYEENPALFHNFGETAMRCLTLPQDVFTETEAKARLSELKSALERGAAFDEAAAAAGIGDYAFLRVFDAAAMRSPDVESYPEVSDAIYGLPVGSATGLIRNGDLEWIVLYCESRGDDGRRSYEECRDELAGMWQEQAFDEAFEKMAQSAQIQIFDSAAADLFGESAIVSE